MSPDAAPGPGPRAVPNGKTERLERYAAAEDRVAAVRLLVVASGWILYPVFFDHAGTIPALAYGLLAAASVYGLFVYWNRPHRRFPILLSAYFTSATDAIITMLWLYATGGFDSPFYVALYMAIVAIAFRYSALESAIAALIYAGAYVALLAVVGELAPNRGEVAVRVTYVFLAAALGWVVSHEIVTHVRRAASARQAVDVAETAEAQVREVLEGAPDAMVVVDDQSRITYANARTREVLGYEPTELVGQRIVSILPGGFDGRARARATGFADARKGTPTGMGLVARRKDGSTLAADVSLGRMSTAQGRSVVVAIRDATVRRAAQETQALLASIVQASPDAIGSLALDGTILTWNPAAERLFGYTAGEAVGRNFRMLVPPERMKEAAWIEETLAAGGEIRDFETERLAKGERRFAAAVTTTPIRRPDGSVVARAALVRDISERVRAERAAQEALRRLNEAQAIAHVGSWEWDLATGVVTWSPEMYRIYDYPEETPITFDRAMEKVLPEDAARIRQDLARALESTGPAELEFPVADYRIALADGSIRWLQGRGLALRGGDGKWARLVGTVQEVTAAKRARDEVERQTALVHEAEAIANVGFWAWDVPTNRVAWSDGLCRLFGRERSTAPLNYESYLELVHPDDRAMVDTAIRLAFARRSGFGFEHRAELPDGAVRWMRCLGRVVTDETGRPTRMLGTAQDITERRGADDAVARHAAELERSNEDLNQFAYVVSHDLQEPLRAVMSCIELLTERHGRSFDDEGTQLARFAMDESGHMQELVQGLLAYARLNTRPPDVEPTDATAAVETAISALRHPIAETGAEVVHGPLPVVAADAGQLARVFQNLISNGIKYARPGEPPRVAVQARRQGAEWIFSVRDHGIGVDSKHHDKLFRVFGRLHTREDVPGTGLGLAVCKKIVERHGGRIWLEAPTGAGVAVHFTLPALHSIESPPARQAQAAADVQDGAP